MQNCRGLSGIESLPLSIAQAVAVNPCQRMYVGSIKPRLWAVGCGLWPETEALLKGHSHEAHVPVAIAKTPFDT